MRTPGWLTASGKISKALGVVDAEMEAQLYGRFFDIEERFWWSVGTRRMFFETLARCVERRPQRVLDVGCGTGVMLHEFPQSGAELYGLDLSSLALSYTRRRGLVNLVRGDVTRLPFTTGGLDLVLALDVIEHVAADAFCVRELARVCRVGGHVLLHVPAFPILWTEKDDLNHHCRRYRRRALVGLVEQCGLRIVRLSYVNAFLFPLALVQGLIGRLRGRWRSTPPSVDSLARLYEVSDGVNRAMIRVMDLERRIARYLRLPFGMSIMCLAQKVG